jgi:hypothetical protein
MNVLAIVFGVVVIVIVYVLYVYVFSGTKYTLAKNIYLAKDTQTINNKDIVTPGATNFNVSFWMYVNSWPTNSTRTSLLSMSDGSNTYWKFQLGETSPELSFITGSNSVIISRNIPIQKWCYVVANVSGEYVDCYLDGKLVMSQKTGSFVAPGADNTTVQINVGGDPKSDVYLSNVQRVIGSVNTKNVWTTYVSTSNPTSVGPLPSYNVQLSLLSNGAVQNSMKLY